mmetsp:Transcript_94761/g.238881  ORF Transcript_94761/g.238881 Transcript_94761/m.238881 type:complete len:223 (-) Transcript_94761:81-749(-)
MPILPTRKRPHRDQDVQVIGPSVHDQLDAERQLDLDTPQAHEFQARVDMFALAAESRTDKAIDFKYRREVRQDFLLVPCGTAFARVHSQHVALQEGTTHGHRRDDAGHARATRGVPALDLHALCAHNPEVAMLEHPDLRTAIEHKDMWISPKHAGALLAARWARIVYEANLPSAAVLCFQQPDALQLRASGEQAVIGGCTGRILLRRASSHRHEGEPHKHRG